MSPVAKALALVAAAVALVGVVAIAVVTVAVVRGDDPLGVLAIPILLVGFVLAIGTLLVFAVIFQGIRNLRDEPEDSI
jgi:TRAP-type C4-dicarboxylate transport system permease small subunit